MFPKQLIRDGVRYPNVNLAEDAELLRQALRGSRRLVHPPNDGAFIYMRHGANAWQFETGRFLGPTGWRPARSPGQFSEDLLKAYRAAPSLRSPALKKAPLSEPRP